MRERESYWLLIDQNPQFTHLKQCELFEFVLASVCKACTLCCNCEICLKFKYKWGEDHIILRANADGKKNLQHNNKLKAKLEKS